MAFLTEFSWRVWVGLYVSYLDYMSQFSSVTQSCATLCDPWTAACQASLSITKSQSLLKLMSTESVMPSNHLNLCVPFFSCLQSFPASGLYKWVSSLYQVAKVLEFRLQHQSFQWIYTTDFLQDRLVGSPCSPRDTKNLLQLLSSKASVLQHSAFCKVELSHPYITTGKTIALTKTDVCWQSNISAF